jgi:dTMP kinase
MSGLFVTVDGPGGIGKSSLVKALAARLTADGHPVHATAEPSGRPVGAFTRSFADQVSGHALACLVAADRYDHLQHEIRPLLTAGTTVVCDRYLGSSLVLQRLDGVPTDFILQLHAAADLPDLAVILTAPPETITARIAARGAHHRFERDLDIPAREVTLYREASITLDKLGVPVLTLDVARITPSDAANRIAGFITARHR